MRGRGDVVSGAVVSDGSGWRSKKESIIVQILIIDVLVAVVCNKSVCRKI